jgi:hypothetical protein
VTFTGQAAYRSGDLNFDRNISAADWVAFKNGQGTDFTQIFSAAESYAKGDLDGDFDHDLNDFVVFKSTFDAANGAGAFQAMLASVPEPSSALLLIAGAVLGMCRRIRGRGALVFLIGGMLCHAGAEAVHAQTVLPGLVGSDLTDPDNMAPLAVGIVAEGTFPANEAPPLALDNNTGTKWLSFLPNGAFYQVQFSSGGQSAVNRYTITSANDVPDRDPYAWTLQGSNDGTAFTTVDTRTAQEFDARFQTRDYTFTNTTPYAFYRFNFQTELGAGGPAPGAPTALQLAEIELFGTPVTALALEVNAATGSIRIANNTTNPISFDAYEIRSAAGSLNRDNWWGAGSQAAKNGGQSIHDQTITGFPSGTIGNGNGWEEGPGSTDNEISEWFLGPGGVGTSSLGAGQAITMNNVFRPGAAQDLTFDYRSVGAPFRGTVTYSGAPVGVTGDYNGNGVVDAADYVLWRNGGPLMNDPTNGIQPEDYNVWRANFGRTPGGGASLGDGSAVPEPTGLVLALLVPGLLGGLRWRRAAVAVNCQNRSDSQPILRRNAMAKIVLKRSWLLVGAAAASLFLSGAASASTLDRNYRLGDDAQENAVVGQTVGQSSVVPGSTLDSASQGSFFDLAQMGGPTYVNPQATGRPGAVATNKAVQFTGSSSQYLFGSGLGSPREGAAAANPPILDYANDRLMQLWVRPTLDTGARQDVISDTYQFGVFISDTDMWGHVYGQDSQAPPEEGDSYVTTAPVAYNQWTHIMQRTFDNDSVALYVNGVAVSRFNDNYLEATAGAGNLNMYVGSNSGATGNFFTGQVDDIKLHVAGVYTPMANPIPVNWGAVDLGTENDFIANQNLVPGDVNGDGVVNGNGTGPAATDDVRFFIDHWLDVRTVNGFVMGDLTSRTTLGDLNFDGRTSLADWAILRGAHGAGASLDLASLLGASIPEPSTVATLGFALGMLGISVRRRRDGFRSC